MKEINDPEFTKWLSENGGLLLTNVVKVWFDGDRLTAIEKLYSLWQTAGRSRRDEIAKLTVENTALRSALETKQSINISFSLFGKKS